MASWLEKRFKVREAGSDVRTEILAGITTFMTMAYIIFVNQVLWKVQNAFRSRNDRHMPRKRFCHSSHGILANYPIALSVGMGLNAFFAFGVVLGMWGSAGKPPWPPYSLKALFSYSLH